MADTNHGSIEFLKFPNPQFPRDRTKLIKKWLRDSWARRKIVALQQAVANIVVPTASTANPEMDGTAAPGSSTDYAREDHVHPHDTAKQDALSTAQLAAVNSGITADDLAVNDASVLCTVTPIIPTLDAGSHYSAYDGCWYYKVGHRVTVHIGVTDITANTNVILFTLPTGYRPRSLVAFIGNANSISTYSRLRVQPDGIVRVYSASTYALGEISFDAFS